VNQVVQAPAVPRPQVARGPERSGPERGCREVLRGIGAPYASIPRGAAPSACAARIRLLKKASISPNCLAMIAPSCLWWGATSSAELTRKHPFWKSRRFMVSRPPPCAESAEIGTHRYCDSDHSSLWGGRQECHRASPRVTDSCTDSLRRWSITGRMIEPAGH
jgi:hypothetical protein